MSGYWTLPFFAIVVLAVVWITARGRLGKYIDLLFYSPPKSAAAPTESPKDLPVRPEVGDLLKKIIPSTPLDPQQPAVPPVAPQVQDFLQGGQGLLQDFLGGFGNFFTPRR